MSIEELVERVTASSQRRVAATKELEQVKAAIVGEDAEAAIRHLFAVTNYLLASQREDFECIIDLVRHLSGVDLPHLRLVTNED